MKETKDINLKWNYQITYDYKTRTFSMHTKKHNIVYDINEAMHTFFSQVCDILYAKYEMFKIKFTSDSAVFIYSKPDHSVISQDVSYLCCYEYLNRPYCFVTWNVN